MNSTQSLIFLAIAVSQCASSANASEMNGPGEFVFGSKIAECVPAPDQAPDALKSDFKKIDIFIQAGITGKDHAMPGMALFFLNDKDLNPDQLPFNQGLTAAEITTSSTEYAVTLPPVMVGTSGSSFKITKGKQTPSSYTGRSGGPSLSILCTTRPK